MWVIYKHPRDYPDKYVLRKQTAWRDGTITADEKAYTGDSIEEVRQHLPPGLYNLPLLPGEDPAIQETWI